MPFLWRVCVPLQRGARVSFPFGRSKVSVRVVDQATATAMRLLTDSSG
jgi:hypothetical protein